MAKPIEIIDSTFKYTELKQISVPYSSVKTMLSDMGLQMKPEGQKTFDGTVITNSDLESTLDMSMFTDIINEETIKICLWQLCFWKKPGVENKLHSLVFGYVFGKAEGDTEDVKYAFMIRSGNNEFNLAKPYWFVCDTMNTFAGFNEATYKANFSMPDFTIQYNVSHEANKQTLHKAFVQNRGVSEITYDKFTFNDYSWLIAQDILEADYGKAVYPVGAFELVKSN